MLKSSSQSKKSQGQSSARGFGAMPKGRVKAIASKGGQSKQGSFQSTSARGFGAMPKSQVKSIASKGGQSSRGNRSSS